MKDQTFGFLVWLYNTYGTTVQATYKEIAKVNGKLCYGTIRLRLLELEKNGYLTIENQGKWHQVYKLDEGKVKAAIYGER